MSDYNELIKQLRNRRMCIQGLGTLNDYPLLGEAADAIEELSKRMDESIPKSDAEIIIEELSKPRWIPVTDALPEAGEQVLCYCRANIYEVMKMRTDGDWVYDVHHIYMHSFVTHWMPLPEPPEEDA